jgi:hypothetical protein
MGAGALAVLAHSALVAAMAGVAAVALLGAGAIWQLGIAFERAWLIADGEALPSDPLPLRAGRLIVSEDPDATRQLVHPA